MRLTGFALAGIAAGLILSGPQPAKATGGASPVVVNITAREDQTFAPSTIVMHVHKAEVLRFVSAGGVHGIASKPLGIPQTMIAPGTPVSVTVTPTKTGTYAIPCTIVCGPNHATMHLTITVKK